MWNRLGRLENLALVAVLAGGFGLAGAGSQANAATLHTAQIVGFSFAPEPLNVTVGDSVQWLNVGAVPPVDVDEAPVPVLLAVSAAACLGAGAFIARRRRRTA